VLYLKKMTNQCSDMPLLIIQSLKMTIDRKGRKNGIIIELNYICSYGNYKCYEHMAKIDAHIGEVALHDI
jgi:hypothetical protein